MAFASSEMPSVPSCKWPGSGYASLDAEIAQLMREVEKLASENLSLLYENQLLRDLRQAAQVATYATTDTQAADHPTIEHGG